jgi:putative selenate reductase
VAELVPVPLGRLLRRAHYEFERRRAIFDLPERKFYRPLNSGTSAVAAPGLDLSVPYAGLRAANPIGPAAGPHTQLAQNIALGWLAGARIFELKTVQLNDRLVLSRPCIDMATVGYNTEWSQELRLDESLREYVKASMLIEILDRAGVLCRDSPFDSPPPRLAQGGLAGGRLARDSVAFDISVGYDLEGIRSPAIVKWLESMRDARPIVEELRSDIPGEFAGARDHPFRTSLAAGITLSTFHGTPAEEVERIAGFLIGELGFHTVIKLNPPMLGRERVDEILRGTLRYDDVTVNPGVYDRNLPFKEAVGVVRRLQALAARHHVTVGVKCGNTLEVLNAGTFLKERVQYLSGQPLHALHAALAAQWREAFGPDLQISFSAGVDAHNVADCVAAGLVPVTACTDLLRAGGYGRLSRYVAALEERMRSAGAQTIPEFIERTAGGAADAVLRNTRTLLERALTDERYRAAQNRKPPRKLGTHLWFWDCVSCSKCIPVCPNDAVFEVEVEPFVGEVPVVEVDGHGAREVERRIYRAVKPTQIAIYADACNACGNCDVFCPEDGGPYLEKPRFFGSVESWRRAAPLTGFVLTEEADTVLLRGRLAGGEVTLSHARTSDRATFETGAARLSLAWPSCEVLSASLSEPANPVTVDLAAAVTLRLLLDALLRPPRVNFVNAEYVE